MRTKSPLIRIAIMAGVPLAILVLFSSVHMERRAQSSQPIASNHAAASAQPAAPLSPAQKENLTSANGAFVSLLNIVNGTLQYSTFPGGSASDTGFSIASDSAGLAYVAGLTRSTDFPVTQGALQEARTNPKGSGFVSKISPNGQGLADLVYSTYFTGQVQNAATTQDSARGIAVSGTNGFITGFMTSPDVLTSAGAFQTALGAPGATNAFVADLPLTPTITITPASNNFGSQLVGTPTAPFFFTIVNNTTSAITSPLTIIITATAGNAGDFSAPAAGGTCTAGGSRAPEELPARWA